MSNISFCQAYGYIRLATIKELIEFLKDENNLIKKVMCDVESVYCDDQTAKQILPQLILFFNHDDYHTRTSFGDFVGMIVDNNIKLQEYILPDLISTVINGDYRAQQIVVNTIYHFDDSLSLTVLNEVYLLLKNDDVNVRRKAVNILERLCYFDNMRNLIKNKVDEFVLLLKEDDHKIRKFTINILGNIGSLIIDIEQKQLILDSLFSMILDGSREIRTEAVWAIGNIVGIDWDY